MTKFKLGIIVPTYNEKDNISELISQIKEQSETNKIHTLVLVMDDNSPDGTADLVRQLSAGLESDYFQIRVQVRASKMGLASAYKQGFTAIKAEVEYLLEMDADLSHQPKYFPKFVELADSGYDLIIGSRYIKGGGVEGWTWDRQLISRLGSLYSRFFLWTNIHDFTGGYNLYRVSVFEKLSLELLRAEGYLFQIELKYKTASAGFKYIESPIVFPDRKKGKSKMSGSIFWEALFGVVKLRLGLRACSKSPKPTF